MAAINERPGPGDLLTHAFELINARGPEYNTDTLDQHFREAAAIATLVLGKEITARDIALIMTSIKLLRSKASPGKLDHYVDGMNYLAFAACFTGLAPLTLPVKAPAAFKAVEEAAE